LTIISLLWERKSRGNTFCLYHPAYFEKELDIYLKDKKNVIVVLLYIDFE